MKSYIYEIKNNINGKRYVGRSDYPSDRFKEHKHWLNLNKHINIYLQRAWNKYTPNSFDFNIIDECRKEDVVQLEQWYLDNEKCEYNLSKYSDTPIKKGDQHTNESKIKIKESLLKREYKQEWKDKIKESINSKEYKDRVEMKRKKRKEELCKQPKNNCECGCGLEVNKGCRFVYGHWISLRKGIKLGPQKNKNKGWSEESKNKIKGRKLSPETLRKLRDWNKTYWTTERREEARKREKERLIILRG